MNQGHWNRCLTAVVGALFGLSHMNAEAVMTFTEEGEVKLISSQVVGKNYRGKNNG